MVDEPPAKDHPLFSLPNVTLTPHSAGPTWENWTARFRNGFDNIQRVAAGRAPLWVVPELAAAVKILFVPNLIVSGAHRRGPRQHPRGRRPRSPAHRDQGLARPAAGRRRRTPTFCSDGWPTSASLLNRRLRLVSVDRRRGGFHPDHRAGQPATFPCRARKGKWKRWANSWPSTRSRSSWALTRGIHTALRTPDYNLREPIRRGAGLAEPLRPDHGHRGHGRDRPSRGPPGPRLRHARPRGGHRGTWLPSPGSR